MTQQVLYDTKSALVLQWQDTDQYGYGPAPANADTLAVTSAEWADQAGDWYVVSGALTQTNPNTPTAAQLLAQAQAAQIAILTAANTAAISAVPCTINGTDYTLDNSPARQTQNISAALTAGGVLSASKAWVADTAYATGSTCSVGGVILFALTGGTTGSSAPTPQTAFGTPVTDGTVAWELFGRRVYLTSGASMFMTAQDLISAFTQGELYMHNMANQLESLVAEVNAATTVSAVQAIVWP